MAKFKVSEVWIETGYKLFAQEGLDHIHIEKLARALGLNKSGFYHYFGTLEIFYEELVQHHNFKIEHLVNDIRNCKNIDPDFLNTLIKHNVTLMAQVHLTRNKNNPLFNCTVEKADQKIENAILPIFAEHVGLHNYSLAARYCHLVRDKFYARISFENFTYSFLHELATEAKEIVEGILKESATLKNMKLSKQS